MNNFLSLGVLSILVATVLLTLTYVAAYLSARKRYIGVWSIAWAIYSIRFLFQLLFIENSYNGYGSLFILIGNITALLSTILLLFGIYLYFEKKFPSLFYFLSILVLGQLFYSYYGEISVFWSRFPIYCFIGSVNIWIGYMIYRFSKTKDLFVIITSISFILWGLHKIDYPFLRPVEWFAPWGFTLSTILQIMSALGLLVVYFHKLKKEHINTEYKLEAMFHHSFQFIGLLDLDGCLLRANQTALDCVGISNTEVIGKFFWDCPWWNHSEEEQNRLKKSIQDCKQGQLARFETNHIDSDGKSIIVDFSLSPFRDDKGEIIYLVAEGRDITEFVNAQTELEVASEIWKDTFDSIGDIVFVVDGDFNIIKANKQAYNFFGKNPINSKCYKLVHKTSHDDKPNWCFHDQFLKSGKATMVDDIEINGCHYSMSCYPIWDDEGGIRSLVHILKDITDSLKMQEEKLDMEKELYQSRKMEAIGTLAGGIAHDFNNVLAVMLGNAELIKMNSDKNTKFYDNSSQIIKAGIRAKDLVKQILTFSRYSAQEMKPMYIDTSIKETIKMIRSSLPKSIEITQNISVDIKSVLAEPTKIHQLLTNLVTNAMHAMNEKGKLHISLENINVSGELSEKLKISGDYVYLSVSDTGCGMTDKVKNRIFDPFYTTKKVGKGTGMGLSVVHGIVEGMKGVVYVETQEDVGSTFHIYLPITEENVAEISDVETSVSPGNERILLVDDEPMVADVADSLLKNLGYEVVVFNNPLEALSAFVEDPKGFDLLITDQSMPHLTGEELIKEILAVRSDMPIILSTGYSSIIDEKQAKNMGVKSFLMKPFELKTLSTVVRESLKKTA